MSAHARLWVLLLVLFLATAPRAASAAALDVHEHAAKAMGMGGAYAAIADRAAASFYNPAGLASLKGLQLELGLTLLSIQAQYEGLVPGAEQSVENRTEPGVHPIPNFYVSYAVHDRVTLGAGSCTPFSMVFTWPIAAEAGGQQLGWAGRDILHGIDLIAVNAQASVGLKLHPRVLVGGGFSVIRGSWEMSRQVTVSDDLNEDVPLTLSGAGYGVGGSAGLLVRAIPERLNVAVVYRSATSMTMSGEGAYGPAPAGLSERLRGGPIETHLSLPHMVTFGVAAFPWEGLSLAATVDLVTWSVFELDVKWLDHPERKGGEPIEWGTTYTVRLGAEYLVRPELPIRVGFLYDQTPVAEETMGPMADGDHMGATFGVGYTFRGFTLDLAYQYFFTKDLPAPSGPIGGTYRARGHFGGVTLSYALPTL